MINETRQIATSGSIHDGLMIETEHVDARDSGGVVALLTMIGDRLANDLAHVLDDELLGCDRFHGEQTPAVDVRLGELERLFAQLELRELEHLVNVVVRGHEASLKRTSLACCRCCR